MSNAMFARKAGFLQPTRTINNPNAYGTVDGDRFGYAVSAFGNYYAVSAYGEGEDGYTNSGKVYIFNSTTGALVYTLNDPNAYGTPSGDRFGASVALSDTHCIVGATLEDDSGGLNSGKAYIFDLATGNLARTLDNLNSFGTSAGDGFGRTVGISGNYCIVGASAEDVYGYANSGVAYIFNVTTGALLHTLNNPNCFYVRHVCSFSKCLPLPNRIFVWWKHLYHAAIRCRYNA